MAVDVPGSAPGSQLNAQTWDKTIQAAIYDKMRFLQKTREYEKGYTTRNIRKITAGTGQTVASTSDGTTMTFDSMTPVNVPMSAAWFFMGHEYPDTLEWCAGANIDPVAADDVENGLAAFVENQYLSDVQVLTQFVGSGAYNLDSAGYRGAVAQLANSAKTEARPGENTIYGLLDMLQIDDAMSVPEIMSADQRGDGQNPNVRGIFTKGYGIELDFTTLLVSDVNGKNGVFWVPAAFGYYYNKRITGEKQRYLKQTRIMADCHFAHTVVHNGRAIGIRTA